MTTAHELRVNVLTMTKEEMINLRDQLEQNWDEKLRPIMMILSMGCINRFKTTISKLS